MSASRVEKPWVRRPPATTTMTLLERTMRLVIANAGDAARRWRYRPVAMVSQGYDTTAVAAVARRLGSARP